MKKFVLYLLLATFGFSMVASAVPMQSLEEKEYTVFTPYEYPIVPEAPEWLALQTNIDKINACSVPDELIEKMSTDALLETFLTHPMATNIFAFSSYDDGFNFLKDNYHMGLNELLQREDLSDAILRSYSNIEVYTGNVPESEEATDQFLSIHEEEINDMWRMSLLEVLAAEANVAIQGTTSKNGVNALEGLIEEKYYKKVENSSLYGPFAATYYRTFAEKNDLNSLDSGDVYLYTPRGTPVLATLITYDYDNATKKAYRERYEATYPNAVLLRDATPKYNCHSYAWYSTASNNSYWLWDVEKYMKDGSYVATSTLNANNRIFYSQSPNNDNHSALVIQTNSAIVRSKWGDAGLYEHNYGDCPYYVSYNTISFWKRNPNDF